MDCPDESHNLQELKHGIDLPDSREYEGIHSCLEQKKVDQRESEAEDQQHNSAYDCDEQCQELPENESSKILSFTASPRSVVPQGVIDVASEEGFGQVEEWEQEQNQKEAIIQKEMQDSIMNGQLQTIGSISYSSDETQDSGSRSGKFLGSVEKHEVVEDPAASKVEQLQANSWRSHIQPWQDSKTESSLVRMLWRQIESLAIREKDAEERLSKERVEHLVAKVEEEVEFEGMVEDMCSRFRAEGEFMDMERQEREWETERREVQLEEEVVLLRSKVETLEEEIRIANAEKEDALQKKQDEIDEIICNMQVQSQRRQGQALGNEDADQTDDEKVLAVVRTRHEEVLDTSSESRLAALREMLSSAEERAERDRRALEDLEANFCTEHRRWNERERHLENQVYGLEKELNSMQDILKERESFISLERERRRQYGLEVDKTLAFWREESAMHNKTCQRMKKLEDFLVELGKKAAEMKTISLAETGTDIQVWLSELLRDLEKVKCEKQEIASPSKCQQSFEREFIERWKAQRDLLEDERDKLEEKLDQFMKKARDNENKIEAVWQERERHLVEKLRSLETKQEKQEILWNKRNAAFLQERGMWELEIDAYRKDWEEEREKVQAIMVDREQWMEEQTKEWACLLDLKEEELFALRSVQKKLTDTLSASKRRLTEIKKQLVRNRRGNLKGSRSKVQKGYVHTEDRADWCTGESDLETSCSKEFLTVKESRGVEEGNEIYGLEAERLAMDMEKEIGKLTREVRREQERLEKERTEVRVGTEQLKEERKDLEKKVSDALYLMEDLKGQIKAKEGQMEWERKQMELILTTKTNEVEKLKGQLNSKEHEIEINVQKFKDEMKLIEKEVEKERKERQEVMDLHFASRRKLIKEMKDKEARWEKEMEAMTQEMQELRGDIGKKDQEIKRLKREMNDIESQTEHERAIRDEELTVARGFSCRSNRKDPHSKDSTEQKQRRVGRQQGMGFTKYGDNDEHLELAEDESNENLALMSVVRPDQETSGLTNSDNHICPDRRDVEWQVAIGKIAGFDRQIADAMLAIQSLKEELSAKETELQRARLERDSDSRMRDTAWLEEQEQRKQLQEQHQVEMQKTFDWGQREHTLLKEKEELLKLLEAEREDTADAMSILQGAVRELQWALKHYKGKDDEDSSSDLERMATVDGSKFSTKSELVKVHASHLEEVDRFILDLKMKVEEAEKKARAAEVALAVSTVKKAAKDPGTTSALVKVGKDWEYRGRSRLTATGQDELLPPFIGREWFGGDNGVQGSQSPTRKPSKLGRGFGKGNDNCTTVAGQGSTILQQEQRWSRGLTEHGRLWDAGVSGVGIDSGSNSSSSSWMTVRGVADDSFLMRDPLQQDSLTLAVSTPPPRSQRKWLVDASWLENVRKEQAFLRQQLELERQRVSVLGQVEAENRWMEATIVQALEQKRECDTKVLELERKVAFLEAVITRKSGRERSPSSSPFYKSTVS